jgi:hypothetical protein
VVDGPHRPRFDHVRDIVAAGTTRPLGAPRWSKVRSSFRTIGPTAPHVIAAAAATSEMRVAASCILIMVENGGHGSRPHEEPGTIAQPALAQLVRSPLHMKR